MPEEPDMNSATYYHLKATGYAMVGDRMQALGYFESAYRISSTVGNKWTILSLNLQLSCLDFQQVHEPESLRKHMYDIL
jgi:hypothetical protein